MGNRGWSAALAAVVLIGLSGCTHLTHKWEFDQHVADMSGVQNQVNANTAAIAANTAAIAALRSAMDDLERQFGAHVADEDMHGGGGMMVALPVHFDFDADAVRDVDKPILDAFAAAVGGSYPSAVVTVEGFADNAGGAAHNQRLSQRRADNVRGYLVDTAGMNGSNVRAVGYGQARQVNPDNQGPGQSGIENRRVTFVLEYTGFTN